jgi:hypothetical protein
LPTYPERIVCLTEDLQADIASEVVKRGLPVCAFKQRSVADILQARPDVC